MSEYKENTVGWWLSQFKEPLRSRALELVKEDETDEFLASSLIEAIDAIIDAHPWMDDSTFWRGVNDFFYGESQLDSEDEDGWDMAKECAPDNWLKPNDGGEDKAIVDSPEKPKNWIDQELWKWHTDMVKGGVEYADAERGKVKLVADSPAPKVFVDVEAIPESMSNTLPFGCFFQHNEGIPPNTQLMIADSDSISFDPFTSLDDMNIIMRANPHINFYDSDGKLLRKALVDPAVVGYEEPKPIDTIEKKHELRIKNLELVNKWQADEIEFLKGYIDLVIAKVGQMAPQVEMLEKRVQAFNEK